MNVTQWAALASIVVVAPHVGEVHAQIWAAILLCYGLIAWWKR